MTRMQCLAACAFAVTQASSAWASSPIPHAELERARLENEHRAADRDYDAARALCYQHFEVNRCLADAKRKQRDAVTGIKRQERLLNADDRKRKAFAQVQKIEERTSLVNQETAALERARRSEEQLDRRDRAANKVIGQPQAAARDKPAEKAAGTIGGTRPGTPVQATAPKILPATKAADSQKNLADFNKKQQEAAEHRADLDKRRRERTNPLSAPLPAFPASR